MEIDEPGDGKHYRMRFEFEVAVDNEHNLRAYVSEIAMNEQGELILNDWGSTGGAAAMAIMKALGELKESTGLRIESIGGGPIQWGHPDSLPR